MDPLSAYNESTSRDFAPKEGNKKKFVLLFEGRRETWTSNNWSQPDNVGKSTIWMPKKNTDLDGNGRLSTTKLKYSGGGFGSHAH
jgi:hypothetical protein